MDLHTRVFVADGCRLQVIEPRCAVAEEDIAVFQYLGIDLCGLPFPQAQFRLNDPRRAERLMGAGRAKEMEDGSALSVDGDAGLIDLEPAGLQRQPGRQPCPCLPSQIGRVPQRRDDMASKHLEHEAPPIKPIRIRQAFDIPQRRRVGRYIRNGERGQGGWFPCF